MISTTITATLEVSEGFRTNTLTQAVFEFRSKYPSAKINTINGEKFNGLNENGDPILGETPAETVVEGKQDTGTSTKEELPTENAGTGEQAPIITDVPELETNTNGQQSPEGNDSLKGE